MQLPIIGRLTWPLVGLLVVASVTAYMLFAYFVGAEMARTLGWCASKGERCTIAREVDQNQVNDLREDAGL
jgi:hypothetical protein